ncbi:MAG: M23 family metallopeptidase [Rikenellaceae bacterium]
MIKEKITTITITAAALLFTACSTYTTPRSDEGLVGGSVTVTAKQMAATAAAEKAAREATVANETPSTEQQAEGNNSATESGNDPMTAIASDAATSTSAETTATSDTAETTATTASAAATKARVEIPRFTPEQSAHVMIPEYRNPALFKDMTITAEELAESFCYPVRGYITSDYGWRGSRMHSGIDIKAYNRDEIRAAFDGVVRVAMYNGAYGKCLVIRHYNGLETLYAHATKLLVDVNDEVKAGDVIALAGRTGRATGVHLHFEIRAGGGYIDPNLILDTKNYQLNGKNLYLMMRSGRIFGSNIDDTEEREAEVKERSTIKYYTVRSGDSLSRIAVNNHTTVSKLCKLNNISSASIIKIGQRLRVR